jgi:iron complex outermembrane receptor protein
MFRYSAAKSAIAASSCLVLAPFLVQNASAQTQGSAPGVTALPPVEVQAPQARRSAPRAARADRSSRSAIRSGRVVERNAATAPAASSTPVAQRSETAWGPVPGYVASRSAAATKTDTPIMETPQSISVVTRQQMVDRNAQTVNDAMRYTAGVQTDLYGPDARMDWYSIRGFNQSTAGFYLDGLGLPRIESPDTSWSTEPYALERVDILKGPSSVLFGQNYPGGLVSLVSKKPTEDPLHEIAVQYGSFNRKQVQFDLSGPANNDRTLLYRLTGIARDGDSYVQYMPDDRIYFQPQVTYQPDASTKLNIEATYMHIRTGGVAGYLPASGTFLPNPYGRLSNSFFAGDPSFNRTTKDQYSLGYQFEHKADDGWTFRQNLRLAHLDFDSKATFGWYPGLAADNVSLSRQSGIAQASLSTFHVDNQAEKKISTGMLDHTLLFGLDYQYQDTSAKKGYGALPDLNIFNPVYGVSFIPPVFDDTRLTGNSSQVGVYGQDQIKLGRLTVVLGGRGDFARTSQYEQVKDITSKQDDNAFSGRAGAIYNLDGGFAPYYNFAQSFIPQIGADRNGQGFKPLTGTQNEIGIKFQPPGSRSMFTIAAYDIRQQNGLTADPVNPLYSTAVGETRSRGIEFEALVSVAEGLDLTAAYTHQDVKFTKANDATQGKMPYNTPTDMASLWAKYSFASGPLAGLGLGAGVRYIGETWGDNLNTFKVPGYTLVDANLSYDFQQHWRLSVNGTNLFNRRNGMCFETYACWLGPGRAVVGRIAYRW